MKPIIKSAEIRDGVVRVTSEREFDVGVGVQAFYPFCNSVTLRKDSDDAPWRRYKEHGFGIYAGASLSGESLIQTFALGLAYSSLMEDYGMKIGAGAFVVPVSQQLAPDFQEGSTAPDGATAVSYVDEFTWGPQVMITFTPGFGKN